MKSSELKRLIERAGWYKKSQNGSHAKYKHDEIKETIILPLRGSKEIGTGLEKAIRKIARL